MKNLLYNDENIIEHSYTTQEKHDDRKNQRNSREKWEKRKCFKKVSS